MFPTLLNKLPRAKSRDFSRLLTSFSAEQQNIVSEALQGQKTVFDLSFRDGERSKLLLNKNHRVLALDTNKSAIEHMQLLESQNSNFVGLKGNFSDLPALLEQNNLKRWAESCSAIVVEFGPSPQHLKMGRGLDCTLNEPLDLRMHDDSGPIGANLLSFLGVTEIENIFSRYGAVSNAKQIAISIVEQRYLNKNVQTTEDLKKIVTETCKNKEIFMGSDGHYKIQNNIDKVFLALRLFVNNELNEMKFVTEFARVVLQDQARFIVFIQTDKEEKHFRNILFAETNTKAGNVEWDIENGVDMGDGVVMLDIVRCRHLS